MLKAGYSLTVHDVVQLGETLFVETGIPSVEADVQVAEA